MAGRRNVVSGNHHVYHRNIVTLRILVYFVFWSSFCLDHVEGTTLCTQTSTGFSLPVASLCYKTSASASASAGRVVLDGFLTYNSVTTNCGCTLTSSLSTNVSFATLSSIQPIHPGCGSSIRVKVGEDTVFIINCEVLGTVLVSTTQTVTMNFEKPSFGYDSGYCILLSPDNSNAVISLNCHGDQKFPPSTSSTTTTTTTQAPTTTTTTTTTTPITTPLPTTIIKVPTTSTNQPTTKQRITTTTEQTTTEQTTTEQTTTKQQTTTSTTAKMDPITTASKTSSVSSTTMSSTESPSTYNPTTRSSMTIPTTAQSQPSVESSLGWSYVIPALGGGLILLFAIIMAVCYNHRKNRKNLYHSTNALFAYDNKINSPYSSKNLFEDEPGMTSSLSATAQIKAIIVDDVRDDISDSTNVSEGTFVRHSVRQPTSSEIPVYSVVNKSLDAKNLPPDEISTEDEKSASQSKQTTDVDVIY